MRHSYRLLSHILTPLLVLLLFAGCKKTSSLHAVILGAQQDEVGASVKSILENTGIFDVKFQQEPSDQSAHADLLVLADSKYDWSDEAKADFISYVKNGGGAIVLNRAVDAFDSWPDFEEISGMPSAGGSSSDAFSYRIKNVAKDHPVLKGLPHQWMHVKDKLMFNTYSLKGEAEVLSVALADSAHGGNGKEIAVALAVKYGEGRVFSSTLGSTAATGKSVVLHDVGLITLLQRGAEWAATGVVSQEVPVDFPNYASTHTWPDFKPLALDELFDMAASYDIGKSRKYLYDISARMRNCDGKPETYAMYEEKILAFLNSDATVASKRYLCKELSWMGSKQSVPVLEKFVNDKDLKESAQYALFRLNH